MAAGLVTLSGCVAGSEVAEPPAPSPSSATPTPDPTAAAIAAAAADEKLLPMPVEDIRDWAEAAVPGTDTEGHQSTYSGWLSQNSSRHQTNTDHTIDAGTYQVQIACRGDGTLTVSVHPIDAEPEAEPVVCQNSTIAFDAATATPGLVSELSVDGAPTIYALSFVRASTP